MSGDVAKSSKETQKELSCKLLMLEGKGASSAKEDFAEKEPCKEVQEATLHLTNLLTTP